MIIFRNDDVSANTNYYQMQEIYSVIKDNFSPDVEIITGVSVYCKRNNTGALYPDLPLKNKTNEYLYDVDAHVIDDGRLTNTIASHGLFHVKHSELLEDAQKMSIISSCKYLKTNKFIAPFNYYNNITEKICFENGIDLINSKYEWKSLEHNDFDSSHKYWYFHGWRFNKDTFRNKINADIATVNSKQLG